VRSQNVLINNYQFVLRYQIAQKVNKQSQRRTDSLQRAAAMQVDTENFKDNADLTMNADECEGRIRSGMINNSNNNNDIIKNNLLHLQREREREHNNKQEKSSPQTSPDKTNTNTNLSRAQRKRNEAVEVVSELVKLRELSGNPQGDEEAMKLKSLELYSKMVSLVQNISTAVEKSNMVQLWVPRSNIGPTGTNSIVMTTHKELCKISAKKKTEDSVLTKKFMENSTAFFFTCEASSEGFLGLPGRCYVLSRPEFTPSVTSYRPEEYVRVRCAPECKVHTTICLPVFLNDKATRSECPFTILEVALCHITESIGELYATIVQEFIKLDFYTTGHELIGPERYMKKFVEKISSTLAPGHMNALKLMCDTLDLPMAQFWIESNNFLVTAGCPFYIKSDEFKNYRDMSSQLSLSVGQGPVGQAHLKETLIWVDDVQKASQIDWPLHHTSISLGIKGLCACKMRIDCVSLDGSKRKTEAVLEILLDPKQKTSEEQMKTVENVWSYLQKGVRVDGVDTSSSSSQKEIKEGSAKQEPQQNKTNKTNKDSRVPQSVEHISMRNKEQEDSNRKAPWGITLDLLQKQFSKHLKDAATDLGVGSTTLKRICRQYGIARWPRRSLKSKKAQEFKEEQKKQSFEDKSESPKSKGGSDNSSLRSTSSGSSEPLVGESVHNSGKEALVSMKKTTGKDELFSADRKGSRLEVVAAAVPDHGHNSREERSQGGFLFAQTGKRGSPTARQFDLCAEERGASWHAGSGFVAAVRPKKTTKGKLGTARSFDELTSIEDDHLGLGFGSALFSGGGVDGALGDNSKKIAIAPAIYQDFGGKIDNQSLAAGYINSNYVSGQSNKRVKKSKATGPGANFSFDERFIETIHGAHNFADQFYSEGLQYINDDTVHGSTYSESVYGGGDHSVHGTTALAGILNSTLGTFGDDLLGADAPTLNSTDDNEYSIPVMEDADADMMAVLLNENGKDEVPQLLVKLRIGNDTIRFRLLYKWSYKLLLDRIRKLFAFPDSAKLKYLDDEDDMCILQTEHDLAECIKFADMRKKASGNSGNNKSATDANMFSKNDDVDMAQILATGFVVNKQNGGEITIFTSSKNGTDSLDRYETVKQNIHAIPPSFSASVNARKDQITINVKISHDIDTCRFLLEPKMDFAKLIKQIANLFSLQESLDQARMKLTYLDDSEEWIVLAGDLDLDECRALRGSSSNLRMKLQTTI